MLSEMVALISIVTNFVQEFWCSCCGTVFVTCDSAGGEHRRYGNEEVRTTSVSKGRLSITFMLASENRPTTGQQKKRNETERLTVRDQRVSP